MRESQKLTRSLVAIIGIASGMAIGCEAATDEDISSESQDSPLNTGNINVSSPANGVVVGDPVVIKATVSSCGGAPSTAFGYSIDDSATTIWGTATSIDTTNSTIAAGSRAIHFKAWSKLGICPVVTRTITVGTAPSGSGGYDGSKLIPNPPSSATIFGNLDGLSGWAANTGAASACANGVVSKTCDPPNANFNRTVLHVADPGADPANGDGTAALFELYSGPKYATAIWGHSIGKSTTARHFIWDFSVYVNSADYGNSELDFYQILSGHRFMLGTQCNRSADSWDTWNEETQHWVHHPNIACNSILKPNAWHRVVMYMSTDSSANTYTYHAFRIDNVDYALNETDPAHPSTWPDGLIGVQVQLDAGGDGSAVNEWIDGMKSYAW